MSYLLNEGTYFSALILATKFQCVGLWNEWSSTVMYVNSTGMNVAFYFVRMGPVRVITTGLVHF